MGVGRENWWALGVAGKSIYLLLQGEKEFQSQGVKQGWVDGSNFAPPSFVPGIFVPLALTQEHH